MHPDDVEEAVVQQARRALQILGGVDESEGLLAHTTRSRGGVPAKKALRFSSARSPMATRVSGVAGECSDTKSASRSTASTLPLGSAPSSATWSAGGG